MWKQSEHNEWKIDKSDENSGKSKDVLAKETDHERKLKDLEKNHKDEVIELKCQIEKYSQKCFVTF